MRSNISGPDAALPIGVFDSGVGGLTVLRALAARLPGEDFLYLGDTARLPYGAKSPASVARYAVQCAQVLAARGIKMLVVACNTASSVALPVLRESFPDLPVLGVVRPGARAACARSATGRIAVLATESTVQGGAYQRAIESIRPEAVVRQRACALFVALAEEGWTHGPLVEAVAREYLIPLFAEFGTQGPDSMVLGCTHFPALAGAIANVAGPDVAVIDSADTTAAEVEEYLVREGLLRGGPHAEKKDAGQGADICAQVCAEGVPGVPDRVRFLATDGAERFARVGGVFLGCRLAASCVEIVDL
ncbi:glutamate racemase [Paucidesulfovibrio longus]|uniref:glutamate racemase n=1 Tax=Paucidesulfovibrio longus TaxID=889 RepID=UPI0004280692|nr:glutamate racemase [Paucidesulfovibrio longus]